MIEEELKRRQYDTWNKYYQKHKSEINARRKKVREDYKNKLSVTENQLAKAKDILRRLMESQPTPSSMYEEIDLIGWREVNKEAEQFLKEVEK